MAQQIRFLQHQGPFGGQVLGPARRRLPGKRKAWSHLAAEELHLLPQGQPHPAVGEGLEKLLPRRPPHADGPLPVAIPQPGPIGIPTGTARSFLAAAHVQPEVEPLPPGAIHHRQAIPRPLPRQGIHPPAGALLRRHTATQQQNPQGKQQGELQAHGQGIETRAMILLLPLDCGLAWPLLPPPCFPSALPSPGTPWSRPSPLWWEALCPTP